MLTLSIRQRALLHSLLHRDLRKCSASVLEACQRCGWTSGLSGNHALTAQGRRLAELSEEAPPDQELAVDDSVAQTLPTRRASLYRLR